LYQVTSNIPDAELQLFLEKKMADGQKVMQTSDIDFIRVLEDLIDLMIAKNIISFTDFPAGAQKKLLARRGYRAQIRGEAGGVSLISQEEGFCCSDSATIAPTSSLRA
jgi:hypothetical protein